MSEAIVLATNALNKVNELAEKLGAAETVLEGGYVELANALLTVRENRYWEGSWKSWGEYFQSISEKHQLGRAQLYHQVATVKELQGSVDSNALSEMGISKAAVLAQAHRENPNSGVPKELVVRARDEKTTVKDLKKAIAEATHAPEKTDDDWIDLEMAFYATDEEQAEIYEAIEAARSIDPPVSTTLKSHVQNREIMLRLCREFLATYAPKEVEVPF